MKKQKENQKKLIKITFFIVIIFFIFQNFQEFKVQAQDSEEKIKELKKKEEIYEEIIELKKKQQNTINSQIFLMNTEIEKLQEEISLKKNEIRNINDQIMHLISQISEKENFIESQKKVLSKILQTYYENASQNIIISLFSNQNLSFLFTKEDRIQQTGDQINRLLIDVQSLKKNLENEKEILENQKSKIVELFNQLQEKNSTFENRKKQKEILINQTRGEEVKYKNLLEKVQEERRQIEEEIEFIELQKAGRIDYSKIPPVKKGYFTHPVNPIKITQEYGKTNFAKISGIYKNNFHNGLDFGIEENNNIFSVKNGKVIALGDNKKYAYGKWIAIKHEDGLTTLYAHLNSYLVSKGSSVKEGQKIARSGNTGYSTGPHLHFSVFVSETFEIAESTKVKGIMIPTGASLDPMRYLK